MNSSVVACNCFISVQLCHQCECMQCNANAQIHKYTKIQIHKYTNTQIQIYNCFISVQLCRQCSAYQGFPLGSAWWSGLRKWRRLLELSAWVVAASPTHPVLPPWEEVFRLTYLLDLLGGKIVSFCYCVGLLNCVFHLTLCLGRRNFEERER